MQNDDKFLEDLQLIADALGDDNEIELSSNLFMVLMVVNLPKNVFKI